MKICAIFGQVIIIQLYGVWFHKAVVLIISSSAPLNLHRKNYKQTLLYCIHIKYVTLANFTM